MLIKTIFTRALNTLKKKPVKLWAISCLGTLLTGLAFWGFGIIPGLYFCLQLLLEVGLTMVFLHGYREEEIHAVQLFDAFKGGFPTVKRVLTGMAWRELWQFLWGFIPGAGIYFGILRKYQWRLVPYILVNEPEIAPMDALEESQKRTKGYVWKMFLTDLLVAAVVAAVIITLVLLALLFGLIPYVGTVFAVLLYIALFVFIILCVAFLPLLTGIIQAAYYEEITNPTMDPNAKPEKKAAPEKAAPTVSCPQCGAQIPEGAMFCSACGAKMEAPAPKEEEAPKFCPSCGTKQENGAAFCPKCGTKLN